MVNAYENRTLINSVNYKLALCWGCYWLKGNVNWHEKSLLIYGDINRDDNPNDWKEWEPQEKISTDRVSSSVTIRDSWSNIFRCPVDRVQNVQNRGSKLNSSTKIGSVGSIILSNSPWGEGIFWPNRPIKGRTSGMSVSTKPGISTDKNCSTMFHINLRAS